MRTSATPPTHDTPSPRPPLQPGRGGEAPRTIGHPPRGSGDAFEWHERERVPPLPNYDSHRLDDDGGRRFGLSSSTLR
jgi:hypothetical protein